MNENENMEQTVILTDEDGNEIEFEIIGQHEKDGQTYFATSDLTVTCQNFFVLLFNKDRMADLQLEDPVAYAKLICKLMK